MLGAAILDDVWLARGPATTPPARTSLTPSLVVTPQVGLVSFGGRFATRAFVEIPVSARRGTRTPTPFGTRS